MKFAIRKEELLRQLPKGELPDIVYLEGNPYSKKEVDALSKVFPQVAEILSRTEWAMFKEMRKNPNGATLTQLLQHCAPSKALAANLVSVHMRGIRKKFEKHNIPFTVKTLRNGSLKETTYKLIQFVA